MFSSKNKLKFLSDENFPVEVDKLLKKQGYDVKKISIGSTDKQLSKIYYGRHFWARGYFVVTSGTITDEAIMKYIEHQDEDLEKRGDNFSITGV